MKKNLKLKDLVTQQDIDYIDYLEGKVENVNILSEALKEALSWADDHPSMPNNQHLHKILNKYGS